jgi:hypothetical protein
MLQSTLTVSINISAVLGGPDDRPTRRLRISRESLRRQVLRTNSPGAGEGETRNELMIDSVLGKVSGL